MFTDKDLKQFSKKNIKIETVESQIENFKKGFPFINIIKAATSEHGIVQLTSDEVSKYISEYESVTDSEQIVKFVPASGAASRMFKTLFEFLASENHTFEENDFGSPWYFFKHIKQFAFYEDLKEKYKNDPAETTDYKAVLDCLLNEHGLSYGTLPKGLLKFHKYSGEIRSSTEEHLTEGANYANSDGKVNIHFTVSPEHQQKFYEHVISVLSKYENRFNVKYNIDFSVQKPSTDTIAVDMNNIPFRTDEGKVLFRPGGHGALIENLNDISADIIFVKNIDNVVHDRLKANTYTYKKALAGLLVSLRNKVFSSIEQLMNDPDDTSLEAAKNLLEKELYAELDSQFSKRNKKEKTDYLLRKLNRPIRVCGMVKNEGEPGGGPFFVQRESGSVSLQIVEGAQINMNDPEKVKIVKNATHFNPVDLVLSVKDYKGDEFDLRNFIDPETGFISEKSKDGKQLKAQELPGLWNGAMADWLTVFVEVPISTFNPVKIVNDLLRDPHQDAG
jgi:hypothetical protein